MNRLTALWQVLGRLPHAQVPVGPADQAAIAELLRLRPELLKPSAQAELRAAVCSIVATNEADWHRVARVFDEELGAAPRDDEAVTETATSFRSRRVSVVLVLGLGALIALLLAEGLGFFEPEVPVVEGPVPPPVVSPTPVIPTSSTSTVVWNCVPVQPLDLIDVSNDLPDSPRPLFMYEALDLSLAFLGFLLLGLAARTAWILLRPESAAESKTTASASNEATEADLEDERNVPVRSTNLESIHAPPRAVLLETAGHLANLSRPVAGQNLDPVATAQATVRAGGQWSPRREMRAVPTELIVLLELERGDSVWLPRFRRWLSEWKRLGVSLGVYEYQGHPDRLQHFETEAMVDFQTLARRAHGPLVIFSRTLRAFGSANEVARWVTALPAFAVKAWVDPTPGPYRGPAADRARLEAANLVRFPFSSDGLRALAQYIGANGKDKASFVPSKQPDLQQAAVRTALIRWRTAVAMVPDPDWDLVETLRQLDGIGEVLNRPEHVQLLLDHVQAEDQDPHRTWAPGEGSRLSIGREAYRAWISLLRDQDKAFERRVRECLVHSLEQEKPRTRRERLERDLRLARHAVLQEYSPENLQRLKAFLAQPEVAELAQIEWEDVIHYLKPDETVEVPSTDMSLKRLLPSEGGLQAAVLALAPLAWGLAGVPMWAENLQDLAILEGRAVRPEVCQLVPKRQQIQPDLEEKPYRPRMVWLRSGTFTMGSPESERPKEDPDFWKVEFQDDVTLTRSFWLAESEVTQRQWAAVMPRNSSNFQGEGGGGPNHPVELVNWFEALQYANAVSRQENRSECYQLEGCGPDEALGVGCPEGLESGYYCIGKYICDAVTRIEDCTGYRLPTEAEWEYAARAGTTTAIYTGDFEIQGDCHASEVGKIGWYCGNSRVSTQGVDCSGWPDKEVAADTCGTQEIKGKPASPWKLYDMIGNVWEWTEDGYQEDLRPYVKGPHLPWKTNGLVVFRGCGWISLARRCRAAYRNYDLPALRSIGVGIRLARSSLDP